MTEKPSQMTRLLVLNYPEPGRFTIFESEKELDSIEQMMNFFYNETEGNPDLIVAEGGSEFSFDAWLVYDPDMKDVDRLGVSDETD